MEKAAKKSKKMKSGLTKNKIRLAGFILTIVSLYCGYATYVVWGNHLFSINSVLGKIIALTYRWAYVVWIVLVFFYIALTSKYKTHYVKQEKIVDKPVVKVEPEIVEEESLEKYCLKCGEERQKDYKFCPNCGWNYIDDLKEVE